MIQTIQIIVVKKVFVVVYIETILQKREQLLVGMIERKAIHKMILMIKVKKYKATAVRQL